MLEAQAVPKQMHFKCIRKFLCITQGNFADEFKNKTRLEKGAAFRRVCIDLSTRRAPNELFGAQRILPDQRE